MNRTRDEVGTGSGSDRVSSLLPCEFDELKNPVATAPGTDLEENPVHQFRFLKHSVAALIILAFSGLNSLAQTQLSPDLIEKIDKVANDVLARTGVPSASVAIVKDGQVVYTKAFGDARLDPKTPATPQMRYSIGSISKQFTAAAILLLQEQGKLSLDDKVSKYIPNLTRANEVTIRQLLSHTSGYQDFWPQDYVMPPMMQPTTAQKILDTWARKPLDFDPGTKWQYSNTNYVIAGVIIEKVARMPLLQFLQQKVFTPLGMKSVSDTDQAKLGDTDPTGYLRYALGPLRPAPKEGKGWMFAAGELAMPAAELAKWDISIIDQKLLKPASYREFATDTLLKNGLSTHYGLGVDVNSQGGHRALSHGGEVSVSPRRTQFSPMTARRWSCSQIRMRPVPLAQSPAASASSCSRRLIRQRRRSWSRPRKFLTDFSTAQLIVRSSLIMQTVTSVKRR